jgi:hypothetical protein
VGSVADLPKDDDAPPPSGVRVRRSAVVLELRRGYGGVPHRDRPHRAEASVLSEVVEEVFFEVWSLVRALSPLQGAWLHPGPRDLGAAALTMATWRHPSELRERWPELVPGQAGMDRLAGLMVDALCR